MKPSRRNLLSMTAAGLIHVAANPAKSIADVAVNNDLLVRQAAERGHTDIGWLKSYRGLTTAKDAGSWDSEDWNSIGAWEYKVVFVASTDKTKDRVPPEQTLNEHGKLRWECFHVSDRPGGVTYFMKRQKKSYLKNMPLRDVLKLVPLLGTDGGEGQ